MASETPVSLKKKKKTICTTSKRHCVIHNENVSKYEVVKEFTDISWKKILDTKDKRLSSDDPLVKQSTICEDIPLLFDPNCHGYHRQCYQRFTFFPKHKLKRQAEVDDRPTDVSPKKKRSSNKILLPSDSCIFCSRSFRYVKRKKDFLLVKCVTESAKVSITEAAYYKNDSKIIALVDNYCLIAQEAHYHSSCRKEYVRKDSRQNTSTCQETSQEQKELENAHQKAFEFLSDYIQKDIIDNSNVVRMTMLREKYLSFLQHNYPKEYNPDYKTDKLKEKVKVKFGSSIQFWQPNYRSELVYSSDIKQGTAVESAFEKASSEERMLLEAASTLRRLVLDSYKDAPEMPWPPTSECLLSRQTQIPPLLIKFMSTLLSKSGKKNTSSRCERLVLSLSQDICYNITCGRWLMPKQLLLGMTVRHITGSAKLVKILNRFGHSTSHSKLLELETAMCDSVTECKSNLPAAATKEAKVTHFCWDNFDLLEETPSGTGTTHSTHGIIIQETDNQPLTVNEPHEVEKTKKRSSSYVPVQLQPCFASSKATPTVDVLETYLKYPNDRHEVKKSFLWTFCRQFLNNEMTFSA